MENDPLETSPSKAISVSDEVDVATEEVPAVVEVTEQSPAEKQLPKALTPVDRIKINPDGTPMYSDEEYEKYRADQPKSIRGLLRMRLEQIKNKYEGTSERTKNILQMGAFAIAANVAPVIGVATGHNAETLGYAMAIEGLLGLAAVGVAVSKKVYNHENRMRQ